MYNYFLLYLQGIYLNTFLASQTLQISPFIKSGHHEKITPYSYSYDLTLCMLITYTVSSLSMFEFKNVNIKKLFVYHFITTLSAIVFAMLGEVKFLEDFTISGDFWKHLSLREIIVFLIIGLPLVYLSFKDCFVLFKDKRCKNTLVPFLIILILFSINYTLLIINSAKNIHYHIHHAIFASFMAIQFNDLSNYLMIIGNGIYMGVIIEGISFYGIQELYVFMTDSNDAITNIDYSLTLTIISTFFWSLLTLCLFNSTHKKLIKENVMEINSLDYQPLDNYE